MRQISFLSAFVMCATVGVSTAALAKSQDHIGYDFADLLERNGCQMAEADAATQFQAEGFGISDYQAQVLALYNSGYLVSGGAGVLKLTGWGSCP